MPGRQVLTSADLRASGATRLGNVLMLVDGARYSTIDGFTLVPSFGGLAPLQNRTWTIEVDGMQVETGILDIQNLNTLSVPVTSIDSIVVYSTPGVARGRFRQGGTIALFTRNRGDSESYHARGAISAVNETGDPGPFRYADPDLVVKNVDKDGPDVSLDVGLSRRGVNVSAGGVVQQIIPSDPAVFSRNYAAFDDPHTPEMRMIAPFISLSAGRGRTATDLRIDGSVFDDMMFSREIAREVPVQYRRVGIAARHQSAVSRTGLGFQSAFDWSIRDVRNDPGASAVLIDWREQRLDFSSEFAGVLKGRSVVAGIGFAYDEGRSFLSPELLDRIWTPRVYFGVSGELGAGFFSLDGFASSNQTGIGSGISAAVVTSPVRNHNVSIAATIAQVLPNEANPMAQWAFRGLALSPDTRFSYSASALESRMITGDVGWRWEVRRDLSITSRAFARHFGGLRYSHRTIGFDGAGFRVDSREYEASWGSTIGMSSELTLSLPASTYSVSYDYQTVLAGNQLFYDAYNTAPRRQLRLEATQRVSDRFSVKNTLFHYSSSYWREYEAASAQSGYAATVPGFVRWDLAVTKSFGGNRVILLAAVENILNDNVGFHPIGATFDRALRVQMTVAFD